MSLPPSGCHSTGVDEDKGEGFFDIRQRVEGRAIVPGERERERAREKMAPDFARARTSSSPLWSPVYSRMARQNLYNSYASRAWALLLHTTATFLRKFERGREFIMAKPPWEPLIGSASSFRRAQMSE